MQAVHRGETVANEHGHGSDVRRHREGGNQREQPAAGRWWGIGRRKLLVVQQEQTRPSQVKDPADLEQNRQPPEHACQEQPRPTTGVRETQQGPSPENRKEQVVPGRQRGKVIRQTPCDAQQGREPRHDGRHRPGPRCCTGRAQRLTKMPAGPTAANTSRLPRAETRRRADKPGHRCRGRRNPRVATPPPRRAGRLPQQPLVMGNPAVSGPQREVDRRDQPHDDHRHASMLPPSGDRPDSRFIGFRCDSLCSPLFLRPDCIGLAKQHFPADQLAPKPAAEYERN